MSFYRKSLLLILISVGLISCSRIDFVIKWADTFLYYELKSIFDFEGKQNLIAESSSDLIVAELKKNWLPAIALHLQKLSDKSDIKTKEEIEIILNSEVEFIQDHLKKLYEIVAGEIPNLAKTITENNWTHFKEEFEEKNKDILSDDQESKLQDNIENFLGRLSKEQIELVTLWIKQNPPDSVLRVKNRRHIISEMDNRIGSWSADKWSQAAQGWLKEPKAMNLPAYESYIKKRTESVVSLLVDVLIKMSDEQRKALKNNLLDWQKKLG